MKYQGVLAVKAATPEEWRKWLNENHRSSDSVWLIIYKKNSGIPSVNYSEAVDEALCFGWIDSKPNKRDDLSYYQYFSKRNPKSKWSKINKNKVERLLNNDLITEAGHEMIRLAKESGTWNALDDIDNLVIPSDLKGAFDLNETAFENWKNFPDSVKRGILEWISNARRPETRHKRISETIKKAKLNERANQYKRK